jgi:hypothetical protein
MAEWWTKRSLLPSSGVIKPKPLSLLNHFTVPFVRIVASPSEYECWSKRAVTERPRWASMHLSLQREVLRRSD